MSSANAPADLSWLDAVNQKLKSDWFIDLADAGLSDEEALHYRDPGQTADSFVHWFAEKYDLTRFDTLEDF